MKTFASCIALCTLTLAAPALVRADDAKPAPKKEAKKGKKDEPKKEEPKKEAPKKEEPKKDAPAGNGW
jgi:hypothetical protein